MGYFVTSYYRSDICSDLLLLVGFLILKFDIPLPGRKKTEEEVKLF
ncbi:hypothetical protein ACV566_06485 [Staphylococcus aureus]